MKYFWLIRHAKSAWAESGQADIDRDLNSRGCIDGKQMAGRYRDLSAANPERQIEWLLTSPAQRAQATSQFVAEGFAVSSNQLITDETLYNATPETLLAAIRATPDSVNCMGLVAHNPGMTWLVNALGSASQQIDNLPTLGSALFKSEVKHWAELTRATRVELLEPGT